MVIAGVTAIARQGSSFLLVVARLLSAFMSDFWACCRSYRRAVCCGRGCWCSACGSNIIMLLNMRLSG